METTSLKSFNYLGNGEKLSVNDEDYEKANELFKIKNRLKW